MHVHVPFCRTICTYCDCATEALASEEQLPRYLDYLEQELAAVSPTFADHALERLYIGGGTPNLLAEPELDRLLSLVAEHHRFRPGAVRCLEGDPRHSTPRKLEIAARHGINRVSFGVQSLDPAILKRVNRAGQTPEAITSAVADAFRAGIPEVNLDYVFGLADESVAGAFAAVTWGLDREASTLCVQLLNDSHFASPYRDLAHRASVAAAFAELRSLLERHVEAHAPRYRSALRPDTVVIYREDLWRAWDGHLEYYSARDRTARSTIGYGRHAQSTLLGVMRYQNQDRTAHFTRTAPVYATREQSPQIEAVSDFLSTLEYEGEVDVEELVARYGASELSPLTPAFDALIRAGHLGQRGTSLVDLGFTPEAAQWLVAASGLGDVPPDWLEPMESGWTVRVDDNGCVWRLRIEPLRAGTRYFGTVAGLGVYYQVDQGAALDAARAAKICGAALTHIEILLERATAHEDLAPALAAFLERRLAGVGFTARVEPARARRHRLTVLAPG